MKLVKLTDIHYIQECHNGVKLGLSLKKQLCKLLQEGQLCSD